MSEEEQEAQGKAGPLEWMARNTVAANLLMLTLIVGGLLFVSRVKQEVFPEAMLGMVTVVVPYPGASPGEVEQGIVLAVEEAVQGVDGVKEIRSVSSEGVGRVTAELFTDANESKALNDIKSAVDRITSFPRDAEEPVISLSSNRREVTSLILYGNLDEKSLDRLAEQARDELLQDNRITIVEIEGLPPPEISIEISQENLRRFGLTLGAVAERVRAASVELGGGGVKTAGGEVLLRTAERRDIGGEFENIIVVARPGGTEVTLGDIADVRDTFREVEREAYYNGDRAVKLSVFRIGEQSPLDISEAVHGYVERARADLPPEVHIAVWNDTSEIYGQRIGLLLKNGMIGLCLVLCVLGLFLQLRLAFWVMLGMATAFVGAFLFMPALGVSINMISLFAFLLVLGIVVDDAIVVGEAVYYHERKGLAPLSAAIHGVREVSGPVTFSVLTTVIAFSPLLFVPGIMGEFFANIPLIVIPILLLSLVESLLVLPAHLGHHSRSSEGRGILGWAHRAQQRFSDGIERFIDRRYAPFAEKLLIHRYFTIALAMGVVILTIGLVAGGRISFNFFPKIEGDIIRADLALQFGAPVADTREIMDMLIATAKETLEEAGGEDNLSRGIYAEIGATGIGEMAPAMGEASLGGGHLASVAVSLVPASEREVSAARLTQIWRQKVGEIPGIDRLSFNFSVGPGAGAKIAIELAHQDTETLQTAARRLAESLGTYSGVFDIDDGFQEGKEQLDLTLKPAARALGIMEQDLARQVRAAFFGAEAVRQQRGRDELRVYVRRPLAERQSEYAIENLLIRTPGGGEVPLRQAATVKRVRSYTQIEREQGRRVVDVTADVDAEITTGGEVTESLEQEVLPELMRDIPGLTYELSGEQQEQAEAMASLRSGILLALFAMFALLAVAFRSYVQPVLVMFAIPFGFVGAIVGHMIMGYDLSLISLFGMVALAGVVVNDSLVLISAINDFRREGMTAMEAVAQGGVRRFRPIILTSLTTFFGLAPMILETSVQARFLIPMAISLGFGVLFVTVIALIIVPASYIIVEDIKGIVQGEAPEN